LPGTGGGLSEGRLLNEFVRSDDPTAFEQLVRRYGAIVPCDFRTADLFAKLLDVVLDGNRSDEQVADSICLATVGRLPSESEY
jgi:hypothetical protein